jgi:hypothetical protein
MNPVHEERAAAASQIQRTMKAWRTASGQAGPASVPKSGGGAPLSSSVRARMEPRLGASLGSVRIHTGGESADAAKGFGARAFTVGDDVHFNAGEFQPGTKEGDKLLAHELTHVVQGQKSGIQRDAKKGEEEKGGPEVSKPEEPAEKEADAVGDKVGEDLHGGDEKDAKGGGKDKKDEKKDEKKDKKDKEKGGKGEKAEGKEGEEHDDKKEGGEKGEKHEGGDKKEGGGDKGEKKEGGGDKGEKKEGGGGDKKEGGDKGGEAAGKGDAKPAPIAAKLEGVGLMIYRAGPAPGPAPGPGADPKQAQKDKAKNCKTPADVDAFCAADPIATQKLNDVKGETNMENGANGTAKDAFYNAMATWIQGNADTVDPKTIYNACMNNLAGPNKFKGTKLDLSKIGNAMQRTQGIGGFWGTCVDQDFYKAKAAGAPNVDQVAFDLWKAEISHGGNPIAHAKGGQILPKGGGTWFTPDSYHLSDGNDAGFSQLMKLAALQPEWFPDGNITFEVDMATAKGSMEARKPTAYDGMQSALWVSRPTGDTFGVTGGGANEFLAGKVPISSVKNAKAVLPSAAVKQELQDAIKGARDQALAADPELKKKIDTATDPKIKQGLEYIIPTLTDQFIRGTATMPLGASVQKMLKEITQATAGERGAPSATRAPGAVSTT